MTPAQSLVLPVIESQYQAQDLYQLMLAHHAAERGSTGREDAGRDLTTRIRRLVRQDPDTATHTIISLLGALLAADCTLAERQFYGD